MNNPQMTAERIEMLAKSKNVSVSAMLSELGMNKNALFTMKNSGYLPRIESLCKFANYFGVSVDYLIGRTDNPNITDTYINGDNNGIQAVNNGNNSNLTVNGNTRTDTEELVEMIQGLPLVQRAKIITQIDEMKNKK